MKESFYFRHDYTAHADPKIMKLRAKHGLEGYGAYWMIVELLAAETGRLYMRRDYETIAYALHSNEMIIESVVEGFDLFEMDDDKFWNKRLNEDYESRMIKSKKASESAKERWRKNANALKTNSEPSKTAMLIEERKGEKKREEKSKEENKYIIPPKVKWVEERINKMKYQHIEPEEFVDYWDKKEWRDKKKEKVTNWHSRLSSLERSRKMYAKQNTPIAKEGRKEYLASLTFKEREKIMEAQHKLKKENITLQDAEKYLKTKTK